MAKRLLILEDGTIFEGQAFGADVDVTGEIVFNTGMTGYQESITDQSYNGQILTFTYPLVGNYGVNRDDYESIKPTTKGVVVSEASRRASNWRNQMTLDEFLKAKNIPGISGIDTRALTKIIRQHGTMKATLPALVTVLSTCKINCVRLFCQPTILSRYQLRQPTQHQVLVKISFWLTLVSSTLSCVSFQNVTVT